MWGRGGKPVTSTSRKLADNLRGGTSDSGCDLVISVERHSRNVSSDENMNVEITSVREEFGA